MVAVGERFRAASLDSPGVVSIQEYERQPVAPGDFLIKIDLCGVCGSDVHWVHATPEAQARMTYPMFLGHEWTGTILEMGPGAPATDVTGQPVQVGDRVWVKRRSCGRCYPCAVLRHPEACIGRRSAAGGSGQRRRYPGAGFAPVIHLAGEDDLEVIKVPAHVTPRAAVLLEPLTNALTAVERSMQGGAPWAGIGYGPGATVVVQGAGPIGALIACVARLTGADKIILVGAPANRLAIVQEVAAVDEVVNIEEVTDWEERVKRVRSMTPAGIGADVVYEAAGVPIAFREALRMVRRFGTVVETGHFTPRKAEPFDPFEICSSAASIYGHYGLSNQAWVAGSRFLARHAGSFAFEKLVTNLYPLSALPEALENMRRGLDIKPAIYPD
ncbi:MAG TPA: alcohol dehydrogenase catalytic domain-containing protein [Chloroflexota bacterium]|jgi:L-iditol 2-dehydrogenase|nr:alcohol dehydrogenase catalytic domain-containing protein [Chloroflexota bacterium]